MRGASFIRMALLFALAGCDDTDTAFAPTIAQRAITDHSMDRLQIVQEINAYRASIGVSPLTHWWQLDPCSDGQAERDAIQNRIHYSFGDCDESAQTECARFNNLASIMGCLAYMWNEGPGEPWSEHGHYLIMSDPMYTRVSVGIHITALGKWWVVMNYGTGVVGI